MAASRAKLARVQLLVLDDWAPAAATTRNVWIFWKSSRSTTGGKSTLTRELDGKRLAAPAIGKEICL